MRGNHGGFGEWSVHSDCSDPLLFSPWRRIVLVRPKIKEHPELAQQIRRKQSAKQAKSRQRRSRK